MVIEIRESRAIFETLATLFESSLRADADSNFPALHAPGSVGTGTTRATINVSSTLQQKEKTSEYFCNLFFIQIW